MKSPAMKGVFEERPRQQADEEEHARRGKGHIHAAEIETITQRRHIHDDGCDGMDVREILEYGIGKETNRFVPIRHEVRHGVMRGERYRYDDA